MKCRSSSKQETKEKMESEKLGKLKESTPHLSGAYIRSLVKQLTSSKTKETSNPVDAHDPDRFYAQNMMNFREKVQAHQPQPPPQHKKQVRRRLHTTRPYQERLLNMAEARREIVTALKFHRANMKQANEQQQQQKQLLQQQQEELQKQQQEEEQSRIYPSTMDNFPSFSSYSNYHSPPPPSNPFPWLSSSPIPPFPSEPVPINFVLPNQTLGLNLNFHDFNNIDFNNIDTTPYYNMNNNPSSSSPTLSSSPGLSEEQLPSASSANPDDDHVVDPYGGCGLHHAMDDEEMAEIRSIGEKHQMEWNDTMNLMTSAWWFKFLKAMEIGHEMKVEDQGFHYQTFDQGMELEFPSWLNGNENCLQQHLDSSPEDYYQDPALPCMELEEIEGMEGEWLV